MHDFFGLQHGGGVEQGGASGQHLDFFGSQHELEPARIDRIEDVLRTSFSFLSMFNYLHDFLAHDDFENIFCKRDGSANASGCGSGSGKAVEMA